MSISDEFTDKLENLENTTLYDPEMLAWKLLFSDEENRKSLSSVLETFTDTCDEEEDPITFSFEVMITIFMELVYGILKINHFADKGPDAEFEPNLAKEDVESIIPTLKQKFSILNIFLSVNVYVENQDNVEYIRNTINNERYCRIIMRHNPKDSTDFLVHSNSIDDDKDYHFIGNKNYDRLKYIKDGNKNYGKTKELKDVFATCSISGKTYKISFDRIKI